MKQDTFNRYVSGFLELVNQNKVSNMVVAEVGTYDGSTTGVVAPVVKEVNGTYIAIDWFKGNETIEKGAAGNSHGYNEDQHDVVLTDFIYNIERVECKDIIKIIDAPSLEAVKQIEDKSLDICFIDADHRYKAVKADILAYLPKIKDGGILSGHDLNPGSEVHFNNWTNEELEQDMARGVHAGVVQAIGEIVGFENITQFPMDVWATRITKERKFEKV